MRAPTAAWTTYLILWMAFRSFTLGVRLIFDAGVESVVLLSLCVVSFVPLVGFMRERPFLGPRVWFVWLLFLSGWALFDRTFYVAWFLRDPLDHQFFGVLLALPAFVATYRYSRPTFGAWTASA